MLKWLQSTAHRLRAKIAQARASLRESRLGKFYSRKRSLIWLLGTVILLVGVLVAAPLYSIKNPNPCTPTPPTATPSSGGITSWQVLGGASHPAWSYSELVNAANQGRLESLEVNGQQGTAITKDNLTYDVVLPDSTTALAQTLTSEGVLVTYDATAWLNPGLVIDIILMVILVICIMYILTSRFGGASNGGPGGNRGMGNLFGQSKARIFGSTHPQVKLSDVAGCEEAKSEVAEIIEFLANPAKFAKLGSRVPRGVLLVGPPGSGKTLLAKAIAGESGASFFIVSGSEFVEMYVGVGAARVRDLFSQARKEKMAIIFVDEIDALGRTRTGGAGNPGNTEHDQTLNQLLVEMDGMDTTSHVIVIAATNRPDTMDAALLRPGRFDRVVSLDNPDLAGREAILRVHAQNKPLHGDVKLEQIARLTVGLSGADLANLLNEAGILAARADRTSISNADIEEATMRVLAGPERKSRLITEHERSIIAYHEAGHALVMHVLPGNDPVTKVSLTSRGRALGLTVSNPLEDRYLVSRNELLSRLSGVMGGRAAEELVFQDITSGAENDLRRVTEMAVRMVTEWGMSKRLGQAVLPHGSVFNDRRQTSQAIAAEVDLEVREIIQDAYARALAVLVEHREALDRVAKQLMAQESIDGEELAALFANTATTETPS